MNLQPPAPEPTRNSNRTAPVLNTRVVVEHRDEMRPCTNERECYPGVQIQVTYHDGARQDAALALDDAYRSARRQLVPDEPTTRTFTDGTPIPWVDSEGVVRSR